MIDFAGNAPKPESPAQVALSFGSNLGDKGANIRNAVARLDADPRIKIVALSRLYRTAPWGKTDQDWFVNACALATTTLAPRALLAHVKALEVEIGRTPGERWGPRVIDIDILIYDGVALTADDLKLPHPEMLNRAFVLVPLAEIAPDRIVAGLRIDEAARRLGAAAAEVTPLE